MEKKDVLVCRGGWGPYLSAVVVEVSGAGGELLGPVGAEMLVEPERGGSGGFSSSPSVDRGEWGNSLGLLPYMKGETDIVGNCHIYQSLPCKMGRRVLQDSYLGAEGPRGAGRRVRGETRSLQNKT